MAVSRAKVSFGLRHVAAAQSVGSPPGPVAGYRSSLIQRMDFPLGFDTCFCYKATNAAES